MSTHTSRRNTLLATAAVAAALVGGSLGIATAAQAAPLTTSSPASQRVGDDRPHADDNGGLRNHNRRADDASGNLRHDDHAEPGDDKGVQAATTVFTVASTTSVAAGDDQSRQGDHAEPGDKHGNLKGDHAEPGDDHGVGGNDDAPGHN